MAETWKPIVMLLESGKRRTIIEKIKTLICESEQEDQGIHTYNRDLLYNIRDLELILDEDLRPVDKQHIESIGIAKTDDEKLKNFLKVIKAGNTAHGISGADEKENSVRWAEKSLTDRAICIIDEISSTTEELLTNEFLKLKVSDSPDLDRIVALLFNASVEEPGRQALFARLCAKQIKDELSVSNVSPFRNALLILAQEQFPDRHEMALAEKRRAIDAEVNEEKKSAMATELLKIENAIRRKKCGTVLFVGHLFMYNTISCRILHFVFHDSLKSISDESNVLDEEAIDSAVAMMVIVGERLHKEFRQCSCPNCAASLKLTPAFPLSVLYGFFKTIKSAQPRVSSELREKIDRLVALRDGGWMASA